MKERTPPYDEAAERSVLGSVFIRNAALDEVGDLVPDDFFRPVHSDMFWAMRVLAQRGQPIDPVTVADQLRANDRLARMEGGALYLNQVANETPTSENARHYAKIVRDKATLRRLIKVCAEVQSQAYGEQGDPGDVADFVAHAREKLAGVEVAEEGGPTLIGDDVDPTLKSMSERVQQPDAYFVPTGIEALDRLVTGLRGGDLVVIAARPGRGKSALAVDFLINAALRGIPGLLFSFEMSKMEIVERSFQKRARANGTNVRTGRLTRDERERVKVAAAEVKGLPLWLDTRSLTASRIISEIRRWFARQQTQVQDGSKRRMALAAVDYAGLIKESGDHDTRERELAALSWGLKSLARELDIPIILVSQLNRESEKQDRKPRLSDLRESGALEQDANMVLFTHWEGQAPQFGPHPAEILFGKGRGTAAGAVEVTWYGEHTLFVDREDLPPGNGPQQTNMYDD